MDKSITTNKSPRHSNNELDQWFIEYYINTASITEAYISAAAKVNHIFNVDYARQYGYKLYQRLQSKINDAINTAEIDDHILGRKVQRELAANGQSEATRLQAANSLVRKKTDKLEIIKEELNPEERKEAIKILTDRIKLDQIKEEEISNNQSNRIN